MSQLKTRGTGPELAIRQELHRRGLRYRVNAPGMPGRPDVVLSAARVVVQVDGCFWHGCPDHAVAPKSNADWWSNKIQANRARDERNDSALRDRGWVIIRVWEHEDPVQVADRIEGLWRARTGRDAH